MPNPEKVLDSGFNKNYNLIIYFNLLVALLGSIFLAWRKIDAGYIYTFMLFGVGFLITIIMLFFKDSESFGHMTSYIKIPFGTSLPLAAALYLLGQLFPFVLLFIRYIVGIFSEFSFNVVSLAVPVFSTKYATVQSFSAAQIQSSMPWILFTNFWTAGSAETFTYNFGAVLFGAIIGYFILQLIAKKEVQPGTSKFFVIACGMALSVILFVVSHVMNSNYEPYNFIIAAAFLLISNISIYAFGMLLTFWIGYHQVNNLLFLAIDPQNGYGTVAVAQGMLSWFGAVFLLYELLLIFYVLRNSDKVRQDLARWWQS
jgi:hypothetical protein